MATINALIIEPGKRPRRTHVENTLKTFQSIVGGYIENVPIGDDISCYCNEDGKNIGLTPNRGIRFEQDTRYGRKGELADIICGTFVIVGYDPDTGKTIGLTEKQADKWEHRFHDPEVAYRTPSGHIGMTAVHLL